MPPADNMPDFDSMTPEEVMAWMESLAKRQGATEGFTTAADLTIAEIDPNSVEIDEPGYVPFGQEAPKKPAPSAAAPPARSPAVPPSPPAQAASVPSAAAPKPRTEPPAVTRPAASAPPAAQPPAPPSTPKVTAPGEETPQAPAASLSGMAWLESLAANQGDLQIDLSSLSTEVEPAPLQPEQPVNPLDWLATLTDADTEAAEPSAPPAAASVPTTEEITDPFAAGVDPMLWLESLARRQGARSEELTTSADMEVPTPTNAVISGPGYTEFSVEADVPRSSATRAGAAETTDPNDWLQSLASGQGVESSADVGKMSDQDIQSALAGGQDIPSDQMAAFFERQMDRALSREDISEIDPGEYDPDAPAVPADLPDWLLEQVQPPQRPEPPALREDIIEPPAVPDLPDWLKEDVEAQTAPDLETIFESSQEPSSATLTAEIDPNDPWVVAFSEEEHLATSEEAPEWYERNLNDPARIAAVERQARGEAATADLDDTPLAEETQLEAGELQAVPDWLDAPEGDAVPATPDWLMGEMAETAEVAAPMEAELLPDWLKEAEVQVSPTDIPDWLVETTETKEVESVLKTPVPTAAVVVPAAPPPAPLVSPAPVPVSADVDVNATLTLAREKFGGGDLEGSLLAYESIIRANAALDAVVSDMSRIADQHKDNPTVYRVLGDGLMRQGRLQAALDTYRKALNQL